MKSRGINFLQNILKKDNEELVKKVLSAQKESPLDGDFCELAVSDKAQGNLSMTGNEIARIITILLRFFCCSSCC